MKDAKVKTIYYRPFVKKVQGRYKIVDYYNFNNEVRGFETRSMIGDMLRNGWELEISNAHMDITIMKLPGHTKQSFLLSIVETKEASRDLWNINSDWRARSGDKDILYRAIRAGGFVNYINQLEKDSERG